VFYPKFSLTPQGLVLQTEHRATQHHIPTRALSLLASLVAL